MYGIKIILARSSSDNEEAKLLKIISGDVQELENNK